MTAEAVRGDGGVPDLTSCLAGSAAAYTYDRIPSDVLLIAKSCVLDWLGVALAGSRDPVSRVLAETVAAPVAGSAASTLLGRAGRAAAVEAARVNGTAGHVLDYDDVLTAFDGHPTAPVLPAVLAVAEAEDASGRDVLTALVAGIETETRINRAVAPSHYRNGFHTTASVGTFGAAAATARLLGLGPDATAHALGLAATSAAGLKSAFGSWGKSLQVGRAAAEGALAALLARRDATGPADGIGCAQGFASTHADAVDAAAAMTPMGEPWYLRELLFKFHASCYGTHSSIEALLRLRPRLPVSSIADIELGISPKHVGMCTRPLVRTPLDAKFSLEFTAALALLLGRADEGVFTDEVLARDDLRRLAARVRTRVDPRGPFTRTEVRVTLTDGTRLEEAVDVGVPAAPDRLGQQRARLTGKFHGLAAPVVGAGRAAEIASLVQGLDGLDRIGRLTALTREPAAGPGG
ncbi:MmgE/PrpD family protein [Streptomyces sp. NPDC004838]